MCSLFSPNCASAPWICCHRHNHWLLEAEAKPTQGNNDWQVTHSQVTVTNNISVLDSGLLMCILMCGFVTLFSSVHLNPAKLHLGFPWKWNVKCIWAPESFSPDL